MLSEGPLDLEPPVDPAARARQRSKNPKRRDQRRRAEALDRRSNRIGDQLATPVDPERPAELCVRAELESVIIGGGLPWRRWTPAGRRGRFRSVPDR